MDVKSFITLGPGQQRPVGPSEEGHGSAPGPEQEGGPDVAKN